jgi:inorganic pyrophosphatase
VLNVFVEITPFDVMKYEVDKESGYLRVDRVQHTSSLPPAIYGFVPRTLAGARVAALMAGAERGDNDPLDVCVLSERPISRAEVVLEARLVGGIPMLDHGEADDKLLAVLVDDPLLGHIREVEEIPQVLVQRLLHYFSTYKIHHGSPADVTVGSPYGRRRAESVVSAALEDYRAAFPEVSTSVP